MSVVAKGNNSKKGPSLTTNIRKEKPLSTEECSKIIRGGGGELREKKYRPGKLKELRTKRVGGRKGPSVNIYKSLRENPQELAC